MNVETLLRTNRRVLVAGVMFWLLLMAFGFVVRSWGQHATHDIITTVGSILLCLGAIGGIGQLWVGLRPRLSLTPDVLIVRLRRLRSERVPLDVVECFFIGQSAGRIRGTTRSGARIENVTVVVRLAQRAEDWRERATHPRWGQWQDGYITIYGLWCEPLDQDVVKQMNHRLAAAKRKLASVRRKCES